MGILSTTNIPKETVSTLEPVPVPEDGVVMQVRAGKVRKAALGGEITSAIYKQEQEGPIFCSATGFTGDEHASHRHGGTERAVHQYNPDHYADWQAESTPEPQLYEVGAYGENLVTTILSEENVCIGDVFRLGDEVLLEVSEPRHPCYKLNSRFQWQRALNRTIRTGRSGWNMRVLRTGTVCKGDSMSLIQRPFPQWSVLNVQRVIRARNVPLSLLAECTQLPLTDLFLDLVNSRLRQAPKTYTLVDAMNVTPRVRQLQFALKDSLVLAQPEFNPYAFAQITFGPDSRYSRSYSIVDGDLHKFSLGVALDRHSRGGSAYLHHELKIGDEIVMAPGSNPGAQESDAKCDQGLARILIVGGIGITAFLPSIREWEQKGLPYHVHYAARSPEQAAFLERLPADKTTLYASSRNQRLDIANVIPQPGPDNTYQARIFSCGPSRMMQECARITAELAYPEHMVHFEDFGSGDGGNLGEAFEVEVDEPDTNRHETLTVPENKTMLDVLNDAGFDIVFSCKSGACGACKVKVCEGKVDYRSTALLAKEKGAALQSCVDRGLGKLKIEVD
ncbi:MOSC domain-containing protein [Aspergillus aculeatinus CBS 121060]|uniref:MOSC domain-containing protein n=1 Tax=Aspergillus aculeatinus CBS 121060 TaxID=1448322 RepID=A0ACD1H120_9EURO|nr:MOSC domain-containing protein [Aspergillus aculeatinus CBS 121060]RAH67115.1 MOSC domain-containing protein [Aspergillus aculeatinus CBS 121060]